MSIGEWWRRLRLFVGRNRATRELEEEMRFHRAGRAEALRAAGSADAEAEARRRFGNATRLAEESRDQWGWRWLDETRLDLIYALRRLRQRPGFALAVIAVLTLGIGATTAMFSMVDAAILRPLPFQRPGELVSLAEIEVPFDPGPGQHFPPSPNHFVNVNDLGAMPQVFSRVAVYAAGGLNLSDPDRPRRLRVGVVTADFFPTLGVVPTRGRGFIPEEGKPGGPAVAVLSYGLWLGQFGGAPMLGRTISLNDSRYLVVGVAPPGFSFPERSDVWIPMTIPVTGATFEPFHGFLPSKTIARLAPAISVAAAAREVRARWEQGLGAGARREKPGSGYLRDFLQDLDREGAVVPLQQNLVGDRRTPLLVLLGATAALLLIACANVTNLLLSQAAARQREIAVREVLGATRARVVRQLLAESILLTAAGTLLGLILAPFALGALQALLPAALQGLAPARLDLRVLGFAAGVAGLTGIGFGLWPAWTTADSAPGETLKAGGHQGTSRRGGRFRRVLVGAELALTVVLLAGAGLMLRSFQRLMGLDRGLRTSQVGTLQLAFAGGGAGARSTLNAMLDRLRAMPGVTAAGAVNDLPLNGAGGISLSIEPEGAPPPTSIDQNRYARYLIASGGYFDAMGIDLIAGRTFTAADDSLAPPVAIINQKMAEALWPGRSPVGRRFRIGPEKPIAVVGIVRNVREAALDQDPTPQMYFPITQGTPRGVALIARGPLPPAALLSALRTAVRSVDPGQAIYDVRMMDDVLGASIAPRRTNTVLISLFAALALLLASLGVYAVASYGVAQRAREFGIRAALGATAADLLALVSREMAWVAAVGLAAGLAGAWALTRIGSAMIYGVTVHDPVTFILVPMALIVPTAAATLLPARRAARSDPVEVMRAD